MGKKCRAILIALFIFIATPKQEANASYFGLITGLGFPSNASATFAFGATLNYDLFGEWGIALTYLAYGSSSTVTADGDTVFTDLSFKNVFAELTVPLGGTLENFLIGAKVGFLFVSQTATVETSSTTLSLNPSLTKLVFGPKIAYDYKFSEFSVGVELSYILGLGSDAPNSFMILPTTKFWF